MNPFDLRRDVRAQLRDCLRRFLKPSDLVCDVGCGSGPFSVHLSSIARSYIGIDTSDSFYDTDTVDIIGTANAVPMKDGVSDAVLSSQVIEHLPDPDLALRESARILKNGGLLFISFPFMYPLHVAPRDFFRYTSHGFEVLCRRHGFEIVEEHRLGGFWYLSSVFCELYFGSFGR